MSDDEVWNLEQSLWLGGQDVYDRVLAPDCIMAFPPPVGIMKGEEISRSLEGAPRWRNVEMTERTIGQADGDLLVLAYRATGSRAGDADYSAYCTSTYRRSETGWRMIQHQQAPID